MNFLDKKMKRNRIIISLLVLILSLCISACLNQQASTQKIPIKGSATLFFHGGGSSYHAEEHMVKAAENAGVTDSVIRTEVADNGQVTLIGKWKKNAKNPICEVNYQNNRQLDFKKHGIYATNVVKALQKNYKIRSINMVGHSLGNISIMYYMLNNVNKKGMPRLNKIVNMAGHFAGLNFEVPEDIRQPQNLKLDKNGKPNKMNATYRQMAKLRSIYPKNQVKVLNIIGDIGGKTDGTVPNVSSLSLKYIIGNRAKSYRVMKFTGKNARHSRLHENAQVDKALIMFLWNK